MIKPIATVIIPAYNHENYIEQCLESIISQTYENIELVIINDGSTDNTGKIISSMCERLFDRFPRFVFVNKPNEGVCKTLNKGLKLSVGEYIAVIASDDLMLPTRIEKQVEYLQEKKDFAMVFTDTYEAEEKGKINVSETLDGYDLSSKIFDINRGEYSFEWMVENMFFVPSSAVCTTRWCYEKLGGYDEQLAFEDLDMFLRVADRFKYGFINEPLSVHRIHGKNSGHNFHEILEPGIFAMIDKYKNEQVFLIKRNTNKLLNILARVIGMTPPCIIEQIKGKKVIGWGTGSFFQRAMRCYNLPISFLVDSNVDKSGTQMNGLDIFLPDVLLNEDKSQVFVIIFSQFHQDIAKQLDKYGFERDENYC